MCLIILLARSVLKLVTYVTKSMLLCGTPILIGSDVLGRFLGLKLPINRPPLIWAEGEVVEQSTGRESHLVE